MSDRLYDPRADTRTVPGTSGNTGGTSGWTPAYAATAALLALVCAVNIASRWHDGRPGTPLWKPVLGEVSSIASLLAFAWIVFAARDRSRGLGRARMLGLNLAACGAFSGLHCLGMWTLRRVVLTALGQPYGWSMPASQLLYEVRKDFVTYAVIALIYQGLRPAAGPAPVPPPQAVRPGYTIRDGARLWRVDTGEILAVLSAGNYVEFLIADGRRIMMRATLAGVAADLAGAGFVRVHRSWLVNAARVRALAPDSSGDYTLSLDGGVCVKLSRRFPEALASLKNGAPKPPIVN